ncbi:hypothetical protein VP01_2752g1 [Puccinia sorghi]|uniref:Uncharacterized protein n=1 Tax=Puccinia sorghi TaxID=27349 RepID=A0A0L6V310_9BASI|nr:hypothetical protein VP01_2752g1 [Puccinia sorghi]
MREVRANRGSKPPDLDLEGFQIDGKSTSPPLSPSNPFRTPTVLTPTSTHPECRLTTRERFFFHTVIDPGLDSLYPPSFTPNFTRPMASADPISHQVNKRYYQACRGRPTSRARGIHN